MMSILKYLFHFSEPCQKVPIFKLTIQTPTKQCFDSFLQDKSRRTLFESSGDGTSKSSFGISMKQLKENLVESRMKNYVDLEWSLVYVEEDGVLLLIFAKFEGKGKLVLGKTFTYGKLRSAEYEVVILQISFIDVESSGGTRRVRVVEGNPVAEYCHSKIFGKRYTNKK